MSNARETLDMRLVNGEITPEEHAKILKALSTHSTVYEPKPEAASQMAKPTYGPNKSNQNWQETRRQNPVGPHRAVSFTESFILFFKNYFDFKGRTSRSGYWFAILSINILSWVFAIFDIIIFGGQTIAQQPMGNVFTILILIPSISLGARRLHDINRSGWWQLLWFTIIGIIPLLYWACKPGDNQQNDYGPDLEAGKET